jgi:hypothetical protein
VGVADWVRGRVNRESLRPSIDDLVGLFKRYLIQETLGPLKAIVRGVGIALGGAVLFGIGGLIVLVGVLRVLQDEAGSAFEGNWSFLPYLITAATGAGLVGLAALVTIRALSSPRSRRT